MRLFPSLRLETHGLGKGMRRSENGLENWAQRLVIGTAGEWPVTGGDPQGLVPVI